MPLKLYNKPHIYNLKEHKMNQITPPELNEGEHYAGAIIKPDGTGHHVIILPGDKEDGTWKTAVAWAKKLGGDLPNRVEQALFFAESKDQFKEDWYWSNTQHASDSDSAWYQTFDGGSQGYGIKSYEMRARAVRRILIIQ
jgi:hypothetical protein